MSSSLSKGESSSGKNTDSSTKGTEEGNEYEKIVLVLLAERGYELSKDNYSQFRDFSIGRQVGIGDDRKLDDIVLRYEDKNRRDSTKNLIFVQMKHKQDNSLKINYQVLFGSGSGNMGRDFKLRQYFISYLNIREELKTTKSIQLKNGEISYIAMLTNIGIDEMDLNKKGINLKDAPCDIKSLFALKKSSFERREANHCYQLDIDDNVNDDLLIFKNYDDLHRIAKDFAQFVVLKKYKNLVMGTNTAPVKYYHVALGEEVIEKTNEIGSKKQSMENKRHFYAKFRNDFIDNNKPRARKELLDSIVEAIRELKLKEMNDDEIKEINDDEIKEINDDEIKEINDDEIKEINDDEIKEINDDEIKEKNDDEIKEINDDEIKEILRKAKWRVVSHFGDYLPPENSSELSKIAKEFAKYISNENETDKIILGKKGSLITHYEVAFEREVIIISDGVKYKSPKMQNAKSESYCDAKFRDEFINCETGPKQVLKKAIFKAIMESDTSKKDSSDYELGEILRGVELRVDRDFGKAQNFELDLPDEWPMIKDDDIKAFFKCFVLFVNQPNVTDLLKEIYPKKEIFLQGTPVEEAIEKLHQKFKHRIEKALGIYNKTSNEEVWLSGEQVIQFVEELQDSIHTCVITFIYEEKVMKYGSFKIDKNRKFNGNLGTFLNKKSNKVFCICTPTTLFTIVKVLQYLNSKKYREKYGQICIEMDDLMEIRNRVQKAFRSENNKLLIIECRHIVNEQSVDELCRNFSCVIKESEDKKIIIICKQNESSLAEKFRFYLKELFNSDLEKLYVQQTDDVNLKDFEPEGKPMDKELIVFQEQKAKINLARLTGFEDWDSYVNYLSQSIILNKADIADIMIKIFNNDKIEVGNKALGTSCLEGAYATLFEEINLDTLLNKLLPKEVVNVSLRDNNLKNTLPDTLEQNLDNDANEIYIFDGIEGSNNKEKIENLAKYLGLAKKQEEIENQLGDIGSNSKIQVANDQFTDENFKQICHSYPNNKILWIYVKCTENEVKFILREYYNPDFYFKRKFIFFKKVVITKEEVKKQLTHNIFSEIFIVQCINDRQEFVDTLKFTNDCKGNQINCETGKIKIYTLEDDVQAFFKECCRQNETVHWFKCENDQIIWCKSHGSLDNLRMFIDKDASEITLNEDDLVKEIKDKKVVIISDDPGMGKTTTITKLYESKSDPESYTATHWIIRIDLKDHLQAIRDIKLINGLVNAVTVVTFFSTVDSKLNHNISKSLLEIILHENKHFSKELLLAFDGFDEVLDECDRSKVISLLKFLKEDTPAKIWITTRLHYKRILENELSIFAIEFVPLDDEDKAAYIKKYLKDRLELILESKVFAELFANNDEKKENERLQKYTNEFLNKMKSIFKENIFRFIGTPLQLYLMLQGSTGKFKFWIENELNEIPNFNYLGNDLLQIYENFVDRKYNVYFAKMGINESASQDKDKFIFDKFNKDFAKSLILNSKLKNTLEKIKYTVLSAGIIKSNGSNIEFIHTTFRDYFAAMVFVHWISETTNELSRTIKQEYILKEILNKPDYQLIRTFINFELKKITEPGLLQESLNHCGVIMKKLLRNEGEQSLKETVLHIAVQESNTNIACFLLNSLIGHRDVLKKFLFMRNESGTALHLASTGEDGKLIRILLHAAAGNSEYTKGHKDDLKDFLLMGGDDGQTALHLTCREGRIELVEILLDAAVKISDDAKGNNDFLKQFIFVCNDYKETALHSACREGRSELIKILLDTAAKISVDTKGHKDVLKKFIFMCDEANETALHFACRKGSSDSVKILLDTAAKIQDYTKEHKYVIKDFIFMCNERNETALHLACVEKDEQLIRILLNAAAGNSKYTKGHKDVLKKFIFMRNRRNETALHISCREGNCKVVKILLNAVTVISDNAKDHKDDLKNFIFMCDIRGDTALHTACTLYKRETLYNVELASILLEAAAGISGDTKRTRKRKRARRETRKDVLKNFLFMGDKNGDTALHLACEGGNVALVNILIEYAARISVAVLQEFMCCSNKLQRNALDILILKSKNVQICKYLLKRAKNKLNLIESEKKICNSLVLALIERKDEFVMTILEEFKHDQKSLEKLFCKYTDTMNHCVVLLCTVLYSSSMVECVLSTAKSINDNDETLKYLLLPEDLNCRPLNKAVEEGDTDVVKMILNFAKSINDNNETLKYLLLPEELGYRPLNKAVEKCYIDVVKMILNFAKDVNDDNYTLKSLLCNSTTQESVLAISTEECRYNTLHIACSYGYIEIIKELISYAISVKDGGNTLKELVTSTDKNNFTPFQLLRNGYTDEIMQVVESFITEARINNDEDVVNVLQDINMKYAQVTFPFTII